MNVSGGGGRPYVYQASDRGEKHSCCLVGLFLHSHSSSETFACMHQSFLCILPLLAPPPMAMHMCTYIRISLAIVRFVLVAGHAYRWPAMRTVAYRSKWLVEVVRQAGQPDTAAEVQDLQGHQLAKAVGQACQMVAAGEVERQERLQVGKRLGKARQLGTMQTKIPQGRQITKRVGQATQVRALEI